MPGAFGGWLRCCATTARCGCATCSRSRSATPSTAIRSCPGSPRRSRASRSCFRDDWPTSAELYLPAPAARHALPQPALAATYRRHRRRVAGRLARAGDRARARRCSTEGFVAEAIDRFSARARRPARPADDLRRAGSATLEPPATRRLPRLTVCKTGPWGQGRSSCSSSPARRLRPRASCADAEYVHVVIECAKLAFADREAWYGDPDFADVPLDALLSARTPTSGGARRRRGVAASCGPAPGGRLPRLRRRGGAAERPASASRRAATPCHLDVVDRFGNMVSATPSGGWLQGSPVIPELGFCLGTRAQMFWLEEGLPSSLEPGKRPRTTLSPTLALRDGEPYLAFGTPGGDQQDQWTLHVFLAPRPLRPRPAGGDRRAERSTPTHFPSSFYPRETAAAARRASRSAAGEATIDGAARRAATTSRSPTPWSLGRVSAVGARAGRRAEGRREPARHAGLRRRPVAGRGQREQCRARRSGFRARRDPLRDQGRRRRRASRARRRPPRMSPTYSAPGRPSGAARRARPERGTRVALATVRTRRSNSCSRVQSGARPEIVEAELLGQLAPERVLVRSPGHPAAGRRPRYGGNEIAHERDTSAGRQRGPDAVAPRLHGTSRRSARNQRNRSAYGTAAFAGDVDGSTKSNVSPSRRSCSPCSGRSRNGPRYASLPTNPIARGRNSAASRSSRAAAPAKSAARRSPEPGVVRGRGVRQPDPPTAAPRTARPARPAAA